MTRLFAWIGIPYLSALTAAVVFGGTTAGILGILFLAGFVITVVIRPLHQTPWLPVVFLAVGVAFSNFFGQYVSMEPKLAALDGQTVLVTGRVCELPEHSYQRFYYLLDVQQVKTPQGEVIEGIGKIRVSTQNALDIGLYDTLEGMVGLSRVSGEGFSSRSSYLAQGISLTGFLYEYDGYAVEPAESYPPYYYALKMREAMLDSLRTMLPPEQAEVLAGAVLGQTGALNEQVREDFRIVGLSHILSVSGLHLALLSQIFLKLVRVCRVPQRLGIGLAMAGILCFMALTGFPASVLRSGIMMLLYLGGKLVRRNVDSLNSLGFAVFCLCVVNPYAAADLGFLLSVSATLGLLLIPPAARRFFLRMWPGEPHSLVYRIVLRVWMSLSTCAAAVCFTLPITILAFGRVSLIAPISNLLLALPSAMFIQLGFLAGILHLVPAFSVVSQPLALVAGVLVKLVCWVARGLAQVPFASVPASFGFVGLWLSAVLFLFGLAILLSRRKIPFGLVSILSVILLFAGVLSHLEFYQPIIRVAVLDVGDGACVVLSRDNRAVLLGCGGYSGTPILRYLKSQGISQVDLIQLTDHSDEEMEHAAQVIEAYPGTHLLLHQGEYVGGALQKSLQDAGEMMPYQKKSEVQIWERVQVNLADSYETGGLHFSVDGLDFLLLPENAEVTEGDWWDVDILILEGVPKYGSQLHPFFTVLSMSEQEESIEREDWPQSSTVYATMGRGAVVFDCMGREVTIRRER